MHKIRTLLFVVTGLALLAACAEERDPIHRVQPNALSKTFFVGAIADRTDDPEFYMRTSVVDVDAGAGADGMFTSSDAQPTVRVRFEITEKLVLARLSYERIEDTDYAGVKNTESGQIVAGYAVEKHFDIRRDYNPSTGEEYNVVVENDADRAWNEREHFRVDWSRNLVTDGYELDTLAQLGIYYGVEFEAMAYYVSEPGHPDAPVFDTKRGYFDVTNKAYAKPQTIEDPWWGTFPACWLVGYFPQTNCNPSELTLRQSYLRVVDSDYETLVYDGTKMDMFGVFTVDRYGYDRGHGIVDDRWQRFAARWDLFERSHVDPPVLCATSTTTPVGADPHRDEDGDGTEDECATVGRGSRCDAVTHSCTIPVRDRKLRTVAWHAGPGHPADLFASSAEALASWNDAVRVALLGARLVECQRTGEADCAAQMGWPAVWSDDFVPPRGDASLAEVRDVFVMCHNPVDPAAGDDVAVCGPAGTAPRLGDLRYNLINVIQDVEAMSPWGIMMDAEDPLSGQKISGSVNVWGAVIDRAAASIVELLALLNEQTAPESFIKGEDVSDWVASNQLGAAADRRGMAMSAQEVASRKAAFDPAVLAPYWAGLASPHGPAGPNGKKMHPRLRHRLRAKALTDHGRLGPGNAALSQRVRSLRGSALEAQLVTPEQLQSAGYDPKGDVGPEALRRASPFGAKHPVNRRAWRRAKRIGHAKRHACRLEGPEPDSLLGLAKRARTLFPLPDPNDPAAVQAHRDQVYQWAREGFNRGVMAHEIGHSMGLRHNFSASFDALNYAPEYWQLRTANNTAPDDCQPGNLDGASCTGPRWRDPLTTEEIEGNIGQYATTSVMDYPGDSSQDMILPGKYDRAAVRFIYGGTVDVWADEGVSVLDGAPEQAKAYELTAFTTAPGLFGVYYFPPIDVADPYAFVHYSRYADRFDLVRDCAPDPEAPLGTRCGQAPLELADYRDLTDFVDDPDYVSFDWARQARALAPGGRVRRGYMFSSDEYSDAGNVPTFTSDAGADAYEQVRFLESQYENRYVLDAFRRGRVQFNSDDVSWRLQARYLDNIQQIAKTFAFGALLDGDPTAPSAGFDDDGYYGPLSLAASAAFDLFARTATRPEPGFYCPASLCYGVQPFGVSTELYTADPVALPDVYLYDFRVALGDGRYLHNDYDYAQGYFWGDYQTQVGTYYDKIWATYYLAEAYDYFISSAKEDFTDSRYKNVSFATVYPSQVRRLYSNLLTGDFDAYAPHALPETLPNDTPLVQVSYPDYLAVGDTPARPSGALLIDPNHAFNEQIYAMVWGSIFFPSNWSQQWVHEARIAMLPSETPDWPPNEIVAFTDPVSSITYRARNYGTETVAGQVVQRAAGARMLQWANRLLTVAYIVSRDGQGEAILDAQGQPTLIVDGNGQPQLDVTNVGADKALARYVDQIDTFRELTAHFEQSLTDEDLPQP